MIYLKHEPDFVDLDLTRFAPSIEAREVGAAIDALCDRHADVLGANDLDVWSKDFRRQSAVSRYVERLEQFWRTLTVAERLDVPREHLSLRSRLEYLADWGDSTVRTLLLDDSAPFSFGYQFLRPDSGEWSVAMIGGLIFHGPRDCEPLTRAAEGADLESVDFDAFTDALGSAHGWSVHS